MKKVRVIAWIAWMEMLRRKDLYVLLILLGALLVWLTSLDVFGLGSTGRHVKDAGLSIAWLFAWLVGIHVSARQLPDEERRGTIFTLLARPVTRLQVLLGKWAGAWSATLCACASFYLLVIAVAAPAGASFAPTALLQALVLHALLLAVLTAFAVALSARLHADAAAALAYVFSGAAFLLAPRIPAMLVHADGFSGLALNVLYHLLPHLELFDMRKRLVHDYGPMPWGPWTLVALYGLLWAALLLALAWLAFRNRRFERNRIAL
jgi:ABC-type transport system involved in multi-copper enzyme maturation permease subunit